MKTEFLLDFSKQAFRISSRSFFIAFEEKERPSEERVARVGAAVWWGCDR